MRNCDCYLFPMGIVLMALMAGSQASGQTIEPASGKALCSALTPEDFTKAGVAVRQLREANLDDAKSAYCIFDDAAGKVELDIYDPAGDTPAEAQNAVRAAQAAIGGRFEAAPVTGADEASSNAASPKGGDVSIVVRRGTTVFNISVPQNAAALQQLVRLSGTVISRLKP